ncbi:carboxylesterase family protein [Paenarthrobacter sp. 2TAF44]|uniref:carboxylesterase family protein n=1 Tax=Paenarthrobacter sp. 2TAF44 TaxID=3233018 RepID=UPI003F947CDA
MLDSLLGPALGELRQQEDAFTLRVQAPADAHRLPVLFFIPGGGYTTGSGESRWYKSQELVRQGRIVLVTVNYRIGVLGHFGPLGDPVESSKPIRDLQAALGWVGENIAAFGGDPARITLAGDSAGAWYAYALSTDQRLSGSAAQTLLISMPRLAPLPVDTWLRHRAAVVDALGSEYALLTAPLGRLLDAQTRARARLPAFPFMPAEPTDIPQRIPRYASSAPMIHTGAALVITTAEESAGFLRSRPRNEFSAAGVERFIAQTFTDPAATTVVLDADGQEPDPYLRMVRAATLAQFRSPALEIATHAPVPVQVVRLDHRSKLEAAYAPHCFVLPFVFGDATQWRDSRMLGGAYTSESVRVTTATRRLIIEFVHKGVAERERYDPKAPHTLSLGAKGINLEPAIDALIHVREG